MKSFVGNKRVRITENNKLVIRWFDGESKNIYSQGKRVKKSLGFPHKYIRIYVKEGVVACIKAMKKDNPSLLISECVLLIDRARF